MRVFVPPFPNATSHFVTPSINPLQPLGSDLSSVQLRKVTSRSRSSSPLTTSTEGRVTLQGVSSLKPASHSSPKAFPLLCSPATLKTVAHFFLLLCFPSIFRPRLIQI